MATSVTLTASASGGDAPYNFLWNTGQAGQNITVNSGGVYSVSVTDIKNCIPAVKSVTVATTPLPVPPTISSNSPVCEGGTLNLFASAIAGATYMWTGPNGFTSSAQNPVITNINQSAAGTYSVTVTVGQCSSTPASTTAIINPIPLQPTASSNSPVCEGTNLNLNASAVNGAIFTWSGPGGFNSSSQNPVINSAGLINSGTYKLQQL